MSDPKEHLHGGGRVLSGGAPLAAARAAMLFLHGRGATAESILDLAELVGAPDLSYYAPQAKGYTWYPQSFLAPTQSNEPWLTSALRRVDEVIGEILAGGMPHERIILLGFSQGACLALEYTARHPSGYAGVIGFSGGLIGPPGTVWKQDGRMEGTPVFLGCSDVDPHIPVARVEESATFFRALGAAVTIRIYPNMEHTINADEIGWVKALAEKIPART